MLDPEKTNTLTITVPIYYNRKIAQSKFDAVLYAIDKTFLNTDGVIEKNAFYNLMQELRESK